MKTRAIIQIEWEREPDQNEAETVVFSVLENALVNGDLDFTIYSDVDPDASIYKKAVVLEVQTLKGE